MDSMPRYRDPTPPKYQSDSGEDEQDLDCKSCIKYKNKYSAVKDENKKLKEELELVES